MKTNGKMKVRRKKRVKWKRSKPLSFLISFLMIVFYMFGSVTIYLGHVVSLELISIQKLKG